MFDSYILSLGVSSCGGDDEESGGDVMTVTDSSGQSTGDDDDEGTGGGTAKVDYNGHEYVDLGMSVMWATCNVGADKPTETGAYFAWGETEEKEEYTEQNYAFYTGRGMDLKITKYNANTACGTTDKLRTLLPEDDAAAVNMGGDWRMPTMEEIAELVANTHKTLETVDGTVGITFTAPNGNSIFVPQSFRKIGKKGSV